MSTGHISPEAIQAQLAGGAQTYLGVIVATTTKNNADTAVPFGTSGDALAHKSLMICPDTNCYVLPGTSASATVTSTNGTPVLAGEIKTFHMGSKSHLACLNNSSGTTNLKVWELT